MKIVIVIGFVAILVAALVRVNALPPHPDDLFWSSDFQTEYKAEEEIWSLTADYMYYLPADFHGRWINVADGFRVTTNQPVYYLHTLWILGNSTTFSGQVPDAETFPSDLQRLMPQVRVMNVGMGGASTFQETQRLKTLPVQSGDTVIFYDGLMELWTLSNEKPSDAPGIADGYHQAIAQAQSYAHSKGATFYHFLQPEVYSITPAPFEQSGPPAWTVAAVWTLLHGDSYDLTHVLDTCRTSGVCFYFDGSHVNAASNAVIAQAIFDVFS